MLVDPCNPPDSLTSVELEDQSYAIGDQNQFYTHADFEVTSTPPDMCDASYITYEYEITKFEDGDGEMQNAITSTAGQK